MASGLPYAPNGRRSVALYHHIRSLFPLGYPASERLEIIQLVGQSHPPVRRTLQTPGVSRAVFFADGAIFSRPPARKPHETDRPSGEHGQNRIPDNARGKIAQPAPDEPEMALRELATRFTGAKSKLHFKRASSTRADASSASSRPRASASAADRARRAYVKDIHKQ